MTSGDGATSGLRLAILLCLPLALMARDGVAQDDAARGGIVGAAGLPALDDLPRIPRATMSMKLERTIFAVDVLRLTVRVDPATAAEIAAAVQGSRSYDRGVEEAVAARVLSSHRAIAEIRFLRDVSLEQFLGAVDDDMGKAVEAGWLDSAAYDRLREGLPEWFSFLRERGILDGDRIVYEARADTLRTAFVARSGEVLLDQVDVGREHIVALLGAYFAPDSSFRRKLIRSLWP